MTSFVQLVFIIVISYVMFCQTCQPTILRFPMTCSVQFTDLCYSFFSMTFSVQLTDPFYGVLLWHVLSNLSVYVLVFFFLFFTKKNLFVRATLLSRAFTWMCCIGRMVRTHFRPYHPVIEYWKISCGALSYFLSCPVRKNIRNMLF